MKTIRLFTAFSFSLLSLICMGQASSNLEVFSENGDPFFLVVNGVPQNDQAMANVKAEGLKGDFHKVLVRFSDASLGTVNQNFALEPGMEQRAIVVLKKKGGYAIRPFGEPVAIADAPKVETRSRSEVMRREPAEEVSQRLTPSTEVTQTSARTRANSEQVNIQMGAGEQRIGINIDITHPTDDIEMGLSETVQEVDYSTEMTPAPPAAKEEVVIGCAPMASQGFAGAKKSISSKSFADDKMTTALQVLKGNCMSSSQIVEVIGLFSFEDDKLSFAKAAYDRCSDPENYWKVNDAFTFSDSIEQLDEYLQSK